jgi:hypothetical protein
MDLLDPTREPLPILKPKLSRLDRPGIRPLGGRHTQNAAPAPCAPSLCSRRFAVHACLLPSCLSLVGRRSLTESRRGVNRARAAPRVGFQLAALTDTYSKSGRSEISIESLRLRKWSLSVRLASFRPRLFPTSRSFAPSRLSVRFAALVILGSHSAGTRAGLWSSGTSACSSHHRQPTLGQL